ncbi:MAG: hypothetical protein KC646_11690 [Candidatus Cloacimonetes bacterium]|nr:hypothetical protein [Candidatus Cloacimonadota bacterium]
MQEPTKIQDLPNFRSLAQEILETEHNIAKIKDSTIHKSFQTSHQYSKSTTKE